MSESFEEAPYGDQPDSEVNAPDAVGPGETEESFLDSPVPDDDPLSSRYKEMNASFTRKNQQLADERRELEGLAEQGKLWERLYTDPEFQREALEALGFELPDEDYEEQEFDPEQFEIPEDPRVEELWAAEQDRQIQQLASEITGHIYDLEAETGVQLTERQRQSIFRDAVLDDEPTPDHTQQVFDDYVNDVRAQQDSWQKDWLGSKQGIPPSIGGEQGSDTFDIRDEDARRQRMAAIIEAGGVT